MPRGLPLVAILSSLVLAPLTVLAGMFTYLNLQHHSLGVILGATDQSALLFSAPPPLLGGVSQSFSSSDARPLLVDQFLRNYRSPMQNNGSLIVADADKYHIDWRLVTAIAFQESNLGRVIPKGSYNAWGWGIYTGKDSGATFTSWPDAIEKVSQGLAKDYYARGLKTPTQIQSRYTPDSNGTWAASVQAALDEIQI